MAKATILLVEDNKAQANIITDYLAKNGYSVIAVEDGVSAFKAAKTESIDLILLDRVLPDMDGSEVCRWLKLDQKTKTIPVIMLTVRSAMTDKVTGLEAGADDYLPKPFDEAELNARIFARLRAKIQQDELRMKNTQLEDMLTRVETLAIMDPLTGLFNRRRFETIMSNEFKRAARYQSPLSCLLIDIDHFKAVNDTYGHQTGDVVLKEVATIVQNTLREVDTPARWGGEEFIVLSPNTTRENALKAAERILKAVAGHTYTGIGTHRITVSIGISGLPHPEIKTPERLIHEADIAMYEAKKKGRNRIEPS